MAIAICLLLAFEPLAFGGVLENDIFLLELTAGLLLVTWAAGGMAVRRAHIIGSPLFAPMLCFAGLVAVQLSLNRSAYWYDTWHKALLWAAYAIILFLCVQCFGREAWLLRFGVSAAVFGFLVALFAILQEFAGNGKFYWVFPNPSGGNFFGPYTDHAHYAGLMEMLIPFPLVFAMCRFAPIPLRIVSACLGAVMGASIFLSRSRGGVMAFVIELLVLTLLSARGRPIRPQLRLLSAFCMLLLLWLVLVPPSGLWGSFLQLQDPGPGRITIAKDSLNMMRQRPLLGWGFGTFSVVYPGFRSFYSDRIVNAAHNDFVEIATETGLAGFAVMCWFVWRLYRTGVTRIRHWRHDAGAATSLAALVGCSGLIAHSFTDFNLEIAANAALFFALAAIATVASYAETEESRSIAGSGRLLPSP